MNRQRLKDQVWIAVATDLSLLGTCSRRAVGAVLLNARGHVIGTGYNGPPAGAIHCTEVPCEAAGLPSGTGLSKCEAIHAEANALMQCTKIWEIETVYCTTSPCDDCVKLLMNTSAQRIVFRDEYPHPLAKSRWLNSRFGRRWEQVGKY